MRQTAIAGTAVLAVLAAGIAPATAAAGTTIRKGSASADAEVRKAGGSFLCPGTATVTATYALRGETAAGSGTFDQPLYVTG